MIQRCKREKSVGNQNYPASVFSFVFQECFDDDFFQTDCVHSNPFDKLVEEWEKNNISKNQHNSIVDSRYMTTRSLLVPLNYTLLSLTEFSIVSHFFFFFFFLNRWPFVVLKAYFSLITIMYLIYAFMFFILLFM